VVDAKSGSGADAFGCGFAYAEVNEDVSAYKIANHNHQPEIQQELAALRGAPVPRVTFVPHLVPMTRGIHATCSAPLARPVSQAEALEVYRDFYRSAPFTRVVDTPPHTKHTLGSNMCLVHPSVDERNGMLVAWGARNLAKGPPGREIENMNLSSARPMAGLTSRRCTVRPRSTPRHATSPRGFLAGATYPHQDVWRRETGCRILGRNSRVLAATEEEQAPFGSVDLNRRSWLRGPRGWVVNAGVANSSGQRGVVTAF